MKLKTMVKSFPCQAVFFASSSFFEGVWVFFFPSCEISCFVCLSSFDLFVCGLKWGWEYFEKMAMSVLCQTSMGKSFILEKGNVDVLPKTEMVRLL